MSTEPVSNVVSILAADVGSTLTKAVLIDLVEGEYRILASAEFPSTLEPPWSDISLAVLQCIGRIEAIAARRLLDEHSTLICPQTSDGNGVDAFVATTSAAEPLRVAIAGVMRDYSVESARKAAASTYTLTAALSALDGETTKGHRWDLPARIEALHRQEPHVIVLVGGDDKAANAPLMDVANAVVMACKTWPAASKPDLIFAGNASARSVLAEMVGDSARLSSVDNVRPTVQSENLEPLETELEALFVERRLNRLPGIGRLVGWSPQPIVATSKAFGAGMRALARNFESSALGIDIGGATTTLAISDHGLIQRVQRSDLGVSHNAEHVARAAGIANVLRWLPVEMSEDEAWDWLANKSARPQTLPVTRRALWLEQAVAREAVRLALQDLRLRWKPSGKPELADLLPPIDLFIGSGGVLTHVPHPGQAVLMLLDALQPVNVANLAMDTGGLLSQLSLIASVQPQAAAQLAAREGISVLGTAICPMGAAKPGEIVLTYNLAYAEGGALSGEVKAGEIDILPLEPGRRARLELQPARQIDLGQGRGRPGKLTVEGGLVGLIIDARGRPLVLPAEPAKRAEANQQWQYNVGA
ncbi:MAG: glutamate mutase L [Chloroflexi bacterium]|nr:glutamate mutase L [Chloroflexota bacterium]